MQTTDQERELKKDLTINNQIPEKVNQLIEVVNQMLKVVQAR